MVLKGDRLADLGDGLRLKVTGRLRVIRHPAAVVEGMAVEKWVEVRIEE